MSPLKAFISYSTIDKQIARQIKTALDEYQVDAFPAHEDINVSQEWKDRIIQELKQANIVVALLSTALKQSDWAPQEIGLASARSDVLFIPLSVDGTISFGFISHIQSKPIPADGIHSDLFIEPIINRFPHHIILALIERMARAGSFRRAESLMSPLVPHFDKFDDAEISAFATASIENGQIWNAKECREKYPPAFLDLHWSTMDSSKRETLNYQIKEGKALIP